MSKISVYLGKDKDGNEVQWTPKNEKNPHFLVVGTSGSGKTETLKAMIFELSKQEIPVLIIDFHEDFDELAENKLDFRNITINPLDYSGSETPEAVMYKISHILKKIFGLGVQQEGVLQDAIHKSYRDKGIDIKKLDMTVELPTFDDVRDILESRLAMLREQKKSTQTIETLLVRLRPLFNTGFFSEKKATIPFSKIFKSTTVLKLRDLPTDEVKYAVAEFFLNKLKYELYSRGKKSNIVLYSIVDEAHRLLDEQSPLNDLLRESRKYGTGFILSSQRPSDFSEIVLANIGAILTFQCRLERDAVFMAKQMGMDFEELKHLTEIGTGYVNFSSQSGSRKFKVKPLWERTKIKKKVKKEAPKKEPEEPEPEETLPEEKEEPKPEEVKEEEILPRGVKKIDVVERMFFVNRWFKFGFRRLFSKVAALPVILLIVFLAAYPDFYYKIAALGMFLLFIFVLGWHADRKQKVKHIYVKSS